MSVFIEYKEDVEYPTGEYNYSPDTKYPEYKFSKISPKKNDVYLMVREMFISLKFDVDNYGSNKWNPLGTFIKKNDKVVIKPNWVTHANSHVGIEPLITHPSVIRAVMDYAMIALDGTGSLIIGDAPIQGADFCKLNEWFEPIWNFYKGENKKFIIKDFRNIVTKIVPFKIFDIKINPSNIESDFIIVDMSEVSLFKENPCFDRFKVANYHPDEMNVHHTAEKHEYLLHKNVLDADVIINMPKPKTHKRAGYSAAIKNFVGTNGSKAWLPHHTAGSVEHGGDEYEKNRITSKLTSLLLAQRDMHAIERRYFQAQFFNFMYLSIRILRRLLSGKELLQKENGCFYMNHTTAKMVIDIAKVVTYADASGVICAEKQRRIINIADMIVVGEGEGPLTPTPKKIGALLFSEDMVEIDECIVKMMGFDKVKIPTLQYSRQNNDIFSLSANSDSDFMIYSNFETLNSKRINHVKFNKMWNCKPSIGWVDHVEI